MNFEGVSNRSVSQFAAAKTLQVSLIMEEFFVEFLIQDFCVRCQVVGVCVGGVCVSS